MRKLLAGAAVGAMMFVAACDNATNPTAIAADARASGGSGGGGGNTGGGGGTSGGNDGTTTITLLTASADAQDIVSPASFWAVQGEDRRMEVVYASANGGNLTRRLLMLRVRKRTQIVRPDGSLVAPGDSVLITVSISDRTHLISQFEPSGLRFTGKDPASLTMSFSGTDHDYNHDGVVTSADASIERTFSIYRQEATGLPWFKQTTVAADYSLDELTTNIPGFTNYVIAY
jgi:hypothetical protein